MLVLMNLPLELTVVSFAPDSLFQSSSFSTAEPTVQWTSVMMVARGQEPRQP